MIRLIALLVTLIILILPVPAHAGGPAPGGTGPNGAVQIAFTRANNVWLMNADGTGQRPMTRDGNGFVANGVRYWYYDWSPDGRYLLVMRSHETPANTRWQMLLYDAGGRFLRSLGMAPGPADFYPTWAMDADRIIFVSSVAFANKTFSHTASTMDLLGHRQPLFRWSAQEGCGGATGDPAAAAWYQELSGFGFMPTVQWSVLQGLVVYTASCGGSLRAYHTATRTTTYLGGGAAPHGSSWVEGALSSSGLVAAVANGGLPTSQLVIADPRTGRVLHRLGPGVLPVWAANALYFQRRAAGRTVTLSIGGNTGPFTIYTSSLWRANPDGTGVTRLASEDAFGLGPISVSQDGRTLIYSRTDNDSNLIRHCRPGSTTCNVQRYGPRVSIRRLDIGSAPITLARNAGKPVLQGH